MSTIFEADNKFRELICKMYITFYHILFGALFGSTILHAHENVFPFNLKSIYQLCLHFVLCIRSADFEFQFSHFNIFLRYNNYLVAKNQNHTLPMTTSYRCVRSVLRTIPIFTAESTDNVSLSVSTDICISIRTDRQTLSSSGRLKIQTGILLVP